MAGISGQLPLRMAYRMVAHAMVQEIDPGDALLFAEEPPDTDASLGAHSSPWKILIADDDHEVHAITRVVLSDMLFEGRALTFLSAYSAAQARALLARHPDIAAILLDVVMETDDAGLRLVHHIREELGNRAVRIILRTGQPGQAPERQVIVAYDINDYKAKSELTAQKLFTTTVAALRSYQHIATIEQGRRGLETIMDSVASLLEIRSRTEFMAGVAERATALVPRAQALLLFGPGPDGAPLVLAAAGPCPATEPVGSLSDDVAAALTHRRTCHRAGYGVIPLRTHNHPPGAVAVLLAGHGRLTEVECGLLEIFCGKVAVGFDNLHLYEELQRSHVATVHALGKLAEYKDEVTGDHVRRLGRWATAIARQLMADGRFADQVDERFCDLIGLASVLHDVGKVGIPDHILRKPGKLTADEMAVMRGHAAIGGDILRDAAGQIGERSYLSMGAEIAESHHERYDGSGYPRGLAGEDIPLSGRIVAVADVYDALLHRRPYKEAWTHDTVLDLLQTEAGKHFDPQVVLAFMTVLERAGAA